MPEEITEVEETEEITDTDEQEDFLDMSDEEFDKLEVPPVEEVETTTEDTDEVETTEEKEETTVESEEEKVVEPEEEDKPEDTEPEEETIDSDEVDYKAEYQKLMGTFKANGTDITPKSSEDAIRLMQQGANYHKKMAGMKPALKALKTLENNGLLDESKLDYLIDISKGNPEAITKLIKEHKIDPLDVDIETESNYVPANHAATDAELALDSVLNDIESTPSYSRTLDVVTKQWDDSSRTEAATNPQIIKVINDHVATGVYDKVIAAIDYDRSMGKLSGVSDFEAYKLTGNRLQEEGAFNSVTPPKDTVVTPTKKVDPVAEQKRVNQKKKASGTRSTGKVTKLPEGFNPLDMSDEEFEKFDPKLIGINK